MRKDKENRLPNASDFLFYIQKHLRPFSRMVHDPHANLNSVGDSYYGGNQSSKYIISPNTGRIVESDRFPTPQANTANIEIPKTSWDLIRRHWGTDCIFSFQLRHCGCVEHYCGVTISRIDTQPVAGCSNTGEPTSQIPVQWHKKFEFCDEAKFKYIANENARPLSIVWCNSIGCSVCCSKSTNSTCEHVIVAYSEFSGSGLYIESFDGGKTWGEFNRWGIVVSAFYCFDNLFFWGSSGVNLYWSDDLTNPTKNQSIVVDENYIINDIKHSGQMLFALWFDPTSVTYGVAVSHNSGVSWEEVVSGLTEIRAWDVVGNNVALAIENNIVFSSTDKDTVFVTGVDPFGVSIIIPDFRRQCTSILAVDGNNMAHATSSHNGTAGTIRGDWYYVSKFGGDPLTDNNPVVSVEPLACGGLINVHRVEDDCHSTYRSTGQKCISKNCIPVDPCEDPLFPPKSVVVTCNGVSVVCGDSFIVACDDICEPCVPETEEECDIYLGDAKATSCNNRIIICGADMNWAVCGITVPPAFPVFYNCEECQLCDEPDSSPIVVCGDRVVTCSAAWISCPSGEGDGELELNCEPIQKPTCGSLSYSCRPYSISKTCPYDLDCIIVAVGVDWIVDNYRPEVPPPFVEGGIV